MALMEQERLTEEGLAELARQILAEHSVESIALESTAKGLRLKTLRVHRHGDEPWSEVIERTAAVVERLEQRVGALV